MHTHSDYIWQDIELRALGPVAMSGHIGVALATRLTVTISARRHTLASSTACPASPGAYVRP